MLVLALLSVCISLSLCVVPVLARVTVFPLLSGLVHKFAATYLTDSIQVEYSFGSFEVRGRRGVALASERLRGITISLFFVTLQSEFLKTLAFAKQGLAPVELKCVAIKKIVIQLATTWKVVVKVEGVTVDGKMVDPNVKGVFELQDAVAMKLNEATNWFNLLVMERTKTEMREKQEEEQAARASEAAPKAFGFKDRVLQQIAAQLDFHVKDVRVSMTGLTPGAAAVDGHDEEGEEKDGEDADVATDTSIPVLLKPTRVSFMLKSIDLLSDVLHENPDEALQLVLTSDEILVEHGISIKSVNICAGVGKTDDEEDVKAVAKMKKDSLKDNEEFVSPGETSLLSFPRIDFKLRVPPMPRLLGVVENFAPIPMKNRVAQLELVSASINRISITREPLVGLLRDLFVPFMDHQALVQSVRALEHDETVRKPISVEDETFYVENYDQIDSNTLLSAQEKKDRHEKLRALEAAMSLNKILKLRSRATGLATYYRLDQTELTLVDYIAIVQENAAKTCNIIFRAIQIALRWDNLCIAFTERDRQVSEMVVTGFGVNLRKFTVAEGVDKLLLDVDVTLGQATFVVNVGSSVINPVSPTTKLMFADFSKLAAESDATTPPQMLTAYVSQFESGEQNVRAAVNNVKVILSVGALEHFLLYVDRLITKTTQVLSTARPPSTSIAHSESSPAPVQVAKSEVEAVAKNVSMSPFSLLGGMMLKLDVKIDDCYIVMLPTQSYSKSLFTDLNVETWQSDYVVDCRVNVPATLSIHLESSKVKEVMEFNVHSFSIGAQYVAGAMEMETILAPTRIELQYTLEQDRTDPLVCHEHIMMQMPDVLVAGSDLSLSLMASCGEALRNMQTTTPDQARLRLESRLKQEALRHQAEVDTVLDRLHRLFDEIDENGNGRIELGELLLLLRRVKVGDTLLESELEYFVRELFKEIDQDGNGFLEFQELRAYLRDDLLSHEASESRSGNGSTALSGFLNLRGNEYHSFEVINKLCETKILFSEQLAEWIKRPAFESRFWELFESEARVSKHSFNGQSPLDVQKKLVRLLKNYDAANLVWDALVLPVMKEKEIDETVCEWLLQPYTHCGGISEYQSAARVIAKKKRDGIFNAALEEAEHLVSKHSQSTNAVKKELRVATDVKMGNLRLALTDTEIPARYCRGDFVIKDVKISMELIGKEIDEIGPVDWVGLTTSANSDWTVLFGFKISSSCYSDIANDMENIIEPWELVAGLSSGAGENGVSILLEAAKRFQINVTPSVLKTYRALMDALDGEAQQNGLQKHHDNFKSSKVSKKHKETDCLVQNFTGCNVTLKVNGNDDAIVVKAHDRAHIENGAVKDGRTMLDSLEIDQWGCSQSPVKLPSFGNVSVGVSTAEATPSTLFVTVFSRLEGRKRQLIVLRSNLYFCNHSSECYEVKYLSLGNESRQAVESPSIKLRPNERISLPLSLLMGITEFYARPETYEHWIVKTSLNNDVLVSMDAIKELNEHEAKRETKAKQHRDGYIVYGETEETCTKVVERLTPNVILRRWYLRSHFEWELALLPPFVVRNSLPYEMEYRFVEYKSSSVKDMKTEFAKVDALLRGETSHEVTDQVLSGVVEAGHDSEVSGVSGRYPGYLSVRLIARKHDTGKCVMSSWSKPLLMMIHKGVEQFTTSRENVEPDTGLKFNIDRMTLPSHPRLVRFSSPYWIVDNTSLAFDYASAKPGAKRNSLHPMSICSSFTYPVMTSLEHGRLSLKPLSSLNRRPKAWSALGNIPETAYKDSSISEHAIQHAQWSEPVNTTAINTMGEIVCGPSVFSVKIEGLYGLFEPGVSLTISPRYFVQNRLNQKLYLQSFSAHDSDPQKVVDMFHKRSLDNAKQLRVALNDGETRPLYHFESLKHGESVEQSQRYVSFSFSEEWGTDADKKNWSFAIPINSAGDLYLQVYSSIRQRYLICQASVQVVDMYIYVVLTDVSCAPPYRIENYTPFTIDCAQLGESSLFSSGQKEMSATIKSGAWHAFAWFNPLSKERHVELRVSHVDVPKAHTKKYDIDYVGYLDPITVWTSSDGEKQRAVELTAQVVVEECTRVLRITEKDLELSRLECQNLEVDGDVQQRRTLYASSFDIAFNGVGLSLLDGFPQEVFFASVDVIKVQKASASLEWTFSILHCQADDMLATAKFPVIMNPINAGYSDKSVGKKEPEPFVKLVVVADLEARLGTYKLLEFRLSDVAVKVDLDYLVSLVKLIEPYLVSDASMAYRSRLTLEKTLQRRAPSMPSMLVNGDGGIRTDLVYFDILRISSVSIELEYSITRKDIVSSTGGGHSIIFGFLSQIVGLIGSNLSGSPTFSFSEIVIVRCFTTKQRLESQLVANYVQQGVMQAYRLIGSADIIGNPIGLVEDLGSGVVEFLKITKGELTGDAHTRGEGVKVLGKTIVKSGASSVAKITGSLDRFVGEFADDDHGAASRGDDSSSSTDNVGVKFAKDLGRGFTGIFTKPVEGALKGGVTGLVQGTVQGITGPGVVLLKGLTATSHTLALGVQSTVVDRSPFGGRRRQPKLVENGKLIAEFDETHYKPTLLNLEVLGANGLNSDNSCDPLCVVRVDGVVVMKTAVIYNTVNPVWQEKTQVALTGHEKEVQFVVKDSYGGTVARTIGKCIMSMMQLQEDFKPPKYSSDLAQWVHTRVKPGNTKKNVSHAIAEKGYPLVMLKKKSSKSSSHAASLGDEKLQVLVTIVSLRDMVVTSSTGSGMLGLGNLGSSTPNISPYVSVHLGKNANRTNTTKMLFSTNEKKELVGNALWGDSFTFPLTAKELNSGGVDSRLVVSLKDKSMIVDTRLGAATLDIDAQIKATPTTEEVVLKDQSDKPIGYLTVKVEVTGSATSSRSLSLRSIESTGDMTPLTSDAVKAGTIRVSCEFK